MERRLAAIMAADMVGYSRLMAADEAGTLARQNVHRKELIDPKIAEYGGRVVKSTGDGVLVEFPSVVDALCCAVTIQLAMPEREADVPKEDKIAYRVGINLGDIIIEDNDIYGDGVNVAARLETLAEPNGICVSHTVVDHVRGKVASQFDDLGKQYVKNIPDPIHVFRVLMQPEQAGKSAAQAKRLVWWQRPPARLALPAILVAGISVYVWQPRTIIQGPTPAEKSEVVRPDKPSIAVLPFANKSDIEDQAYFADGMTDDLITEIAKVPGLAVIARDSTFNYRDGSSNISEIGQALNARYILQGSVRRSMDRVRINANLVDTATGNLVWGDRYDGELADVFDLQEKITKNIVASLSLQISDTGKKRSDRKEPANLSAYEQFLKGRDRFLRFSKADTFDSRAHLEKAINLDPEFADAYAILAWNYVFEYINGWSVAPERTLEHARELADKAISLNPRQPFSYFVKGLIHRERFQFTEAVTEAKKAIEIDPNYANAYVLLATVLYYTGHPKEGLEMINEAEKLNPLHPSNYPYHKGQALFILERYEEAAQAFKRGLQQNPTSQRLRVWLSATYAQLGKQEEAEWEADQILLDDPEFQVSSIAHVFPFKDESDLGRFKTALNKVGFEGRW